MSGAEYEPSDSRNVTLQPNEPGKPSGWREKEAAVDEATRGELAPADSRNVTEEGIPEPGSPTGWREKEAGKPGSDAAKTPPGVAQDGRPFTAEDAAEDHVPDKPGH